MMNQQVNSESITIISVKATLTATNENRFVALPSPASFVQLADKLSAIFGLDAGAFHVQYVDDEGDRVTVSSNDELACALSLIPAGRPLRLFIAAAAAAATPALVKHQQAEEQPDVEPTTTAKPESQPATTITTDNDQANVDSQQDACADSKADKDTTSSATAAALDHLKVKLAAAGITVSDDDGKAGVCEKRCLRVVARFDGDLDKALAAIKRIHERKQMRLLGKNRSPDVVQLEAIHEQRQARRNERIAARLARQELKKSRASACGESARPEREVKANAEAIDSLLAFATEQGLAVGRGRCTGALRRSNGDVAAGKAELLAWAAKRQPRKDRKTGSTNDVNESEGYDKEKLLGQLDQLGFGTIVTNSGQGNDCQKKKAANQDPESIRRRNERLLKRFDGDVTQVVAFLEARKAKVEARVAARQAQHGRGGRRAVRLADEGAKATSAC